MHDGVLHPLARTLRSLKKTRVSNTWSMTCGYYPWPTRAGYRSTFRQWNHSGSFRMSHTYQYQAQRKNVALELDIASPLPAIEVDPGRMTQVLTNILDNALRHTPEGGKIVLSAHEVDHQLALAIRDSGPGLGKELQPIFDRFYRTDVSASVMAPFPAARGWDWRLPNPLCRRTAGSYPRRVNPARVCGSS